MKRKPLVLLLSLALLLAVAFWGYGKLTEGAASDDSPAGETGGEEAPTPGAGGEAAQRTPAPDFTVTDLDGNEVKLSDFLGTPVVINFWATWCGYCVAELPDFDDAFSQYGDKVQFLIVNMTDGARETPDGARAYIAEKGYSFPVFLDEAYSAATAYGVTALPTTVFVDSEGNIAYKKLGLISAAQLTEQLEALLAQ